MDMEEQKEYEISIKEEYIVTKHNIGQQPAYSRHQGLDFESDSWPNPSCLFLHIIHIALCNTLMDIHFIK